MLVKCCTSSGSRILQKTVVVPGGAVCIRQGWPGRASADILPWQLVWLGLMLWCWGGLAPALLPVGMGQVGGPGQEMGMVGSLLVLVFVSFAVVPIGTWG